MDLQLEGKRAIVTGGSRGIGKAIAHALAHEGVDVVIAARGQGRVEAAAAELGAGTGRTVIPLVVDTGDDGSVRALVQTALGLLGGIDILVNNAAMPGGTSPARHLADVTDDGFWADVNVKVLGYLRMARAVAPHLIAGGWGRIVNIGGLAARTTGLPVTSIRNIGVAALTKNLADELGPHGVNVTVVHPGATVTEPAWDPAVAEQLAKRIAIGRLVTAEEVAWVVAFLASPRSVAINGDAVAVGGGMVGAIHY